MAVESIFYSVAGMSCRGALIWEEGVKAPRPLLLMAPNWRGVIKPAIETGQMLADEGGYCRRWRECAGASPPPSTR